VTNKHLAIRLFFFLFSAGLILSLTPVVSKAADNVPRITIQELKEKMDRAENIVILDVRSGEDYASSKVKITGAIRIPLDQIAARSKELPAEKEIIAYCA
jgi:hypothetical protein